VILVRTLSRGWNTDSRQIIDYPESCKHTASMSARGSTLTIRDVPARVVKSLKRLASRQNKSMEQQVRDILEQHLAERDSVLKQIEASWARQSRRPESNEIDAWITGGRG